VQVAFGQPLRPAALALWVHSAQRGGLRTGHSGQSEASSQAQLFRPAYPFQPGETVSATLALAGAAKGEARPWVWQFTTAVGGLGQGDFRPGLDVATAAVPQAIALGDVDGDGDLDLLVSSAATHSVSVRLNGGDASGTNTGQFGTGTLVRLGQVAYSLVLGDVDGDGDLDLLAGSDGGGTVSVRLNGGDASGSNTGQFDGGSAILVGGGCATPVSVALGDVDGDGDLDLLATNNCATGSVSVRLNDGTGHYLPRLAQFSQGTEVAVGRHPYGVALGDVDDDGDLDLLTVSYTTSTVSVRLNNGFGTFGGGSEVAVGSGAVALALGDVDNDGDLDLLTANYTASTVSVRLNGGDASGSNTGQFGGGAEVAVGRAPQRLSLGDVDGDGDLDLLATCTGAEAVSVRLNQPWPALRAAKVFRQEAPGPTKKPALLTSLLVQAYPNSSEQAITLLISTGQAGPATLLLTNTLGQVLGQQQVPLSSGATTLPLATAQGLATGVYLLRVQQGSQQQLLKLVRR